MRRTAIRVSCRFVSSAIPFVGSKMYSPTRSASEIQKRIRQTSSFVFFMVRFFPQGKHEQYGPENNENDRRQLRGR